jgi:acetamidase/formamidase
MVSGEGRIASHSLDVPGVLQVHLEAVKNQALPDPVAQHDPGINTFVVGWNV